MLLERSKGKPHRKLLFWSSIYLNIGLLAFYKYIIFILENLNRLFDLTGVQFNLPYPEILIPVGISYYTFQVLGYLIRINRGSEQAEKNLFRFLLYILFFPKFLSGPVERSNRFFPQLSKARRFDYTLVSAGARLFLVGLFKKVVIGDNLAAPVLAAYGDIHHYSGIALMLVFVVQTLHLYADFSGYTDMALGAGKMVGLNLTGNFNRPFFAQNVGEFWRRWHMSLSSWCNDFIFTPFIVKYRKLGQKAAIIGIFLTFFVIGIWHGAAWTFVVLGLLQGIAISYEFYTKRTRITYARKFNQRAVTFFSRLITFLFFCLTLIFFNAHSLSDAFYFITHLFSGIDLKLTGHDLIFDKKGFLIAMAAFMILFVWEYLEESGRSPAKWFFGLPKPVRWLGYYSLILAIYIFGGQQDTFIYLQF